MKSKITLRFYMKKIHLFFTALVVLLLLSATSCTSYKNVPYLQNSADLSNIQQYNNVFDAKIQPKDLLVINVVSPMDPSASAPYNLTVGIPYEGKQSLTTQATLQTYLVDNDGYINFPVIGKLRVAGKTITEVEEMVYAKIESAFVEKPVVTVRYHNFKISVLGEVTSPGTYSVPNGKVTVFEALALARDLTIYGRRDNVKLIRENAEGIKEIHEINLNDVAVLTSPYYYLQQNDVLYVTPNKAKAKNSDIGNSTSLWFSATSILISLTSLLYNILR